MKARLKQFGVLVFGLFSLQSYGQQVALHGSAREDVARSVYQFENRFYMTGTTRANHKISTIY